CRDRNNLPSAAPLAICAARPIIQAARHGGHAMGEAIPYDFRNPPQRRGRAHDVEALASAYAVAVGGTVQTIEQSRYDEFLASVCAPACLPVLRVDPPGAQVLMDVRLQGNGRI